MDLKSLGEALAKLGLPLLGAALPVPGGAAIGAALAAAIGAESDKPEHIVAALSDGIDAMQKAKEFESAHQETILRITVDAEIRSVEAVNKTMQAEAAADHWPTYSWRPFVGFSFGVALLIAVLVVSAAYVGVIFFHADIGLLDKLPSFLTAMAALLAVPMPVLGIASYFRGKMQADPAIPTDNRG